MADLAALQHLSAIVLEGLAAGRAVEIDGLGTFAPDRRGWFRFEPATRPRVFIAYAKEDSAAAARLYAQLAALGFRPWMDIADLLPGQNWPRAIETAIEIADFFLPCFSRTAVSKRGGFQAEIRYALDCARRVPLEEIYVVPVRLDECPVPRSVQRESQYVDLFPDWCEGLARLVATMRREMGKRER